jgi:hypothetical protein
MADRQFAAAAAEYLALAEAAQLRGLPQGASAASFDREATPLSPIGSNPKCRVGELS